MQQLLWFGDFSAASSFGSPLVLKSPGLCERCFVFCGVLVGPAGGARCRPSPAR